MVDLDEFCNRLINDFTVYFINRRARHLITQSKASCRALIKNCFEIEPDYVLEIGTNYGLSTLSFAYALRLLGKDLSSLITTDIDHTHWERETPEITKGLLLNSSIDASKIRTITEDFKDLAPESVIGKGKVLIFYDIHDILTVSYMKKFISEWMPYFDRGYVMVHDCYVPLSGFWLRRDDPMYPIESATHFSGMTFEGYKECPVLIDWLNQTKRAVTAIPDTSIIRFSILEYGI